MWIIDNPPIISLKGAICLDKLRPDSIRPGLIVEGGPDGSASEHEGPSLGTAPGVTPLEIGTRDKDDQHMRTPPP